MLTAEPLSGSVAPYSQVPVTFICRTKKYDKNRGFDDNEMKKSLKGDRTGGMDERFLVKPEDYATMAVVNFKNLKHEDLKVQMMARACYPDIKVSKKQLQFGECASYERKDYALSITNRNEDLPVDFNFSKAASFKAVPNKGTLRPGSEHTITISFEPKNLGTVSQEMVIEILNGVYKIPLKLMGVCNKVGQKLNATRGPMARPSDFEPNATLLDEDEAAARTIMQPRKTINHLNKLDKLDSTYGVQKAMEAENLAAIQRYAEIQANKQKANEFLRTQRVMREKEAKIHQKMRATNRPPPETLEEIEKDPDMGFEYTLPEPKLDLSIPDQLYVEKPIGKYEPSQ